jgi:hypothetical protein
MADHGITGTHHIDGSPCTGTAACPWSETTYLEKWLNPQPHSMVKSALLGLLPTVPQPQGGPVSNNPITPLMLRDDWIDHPTLTKSDKAVLDSLPDSKLQEVLDEALLSYNEVWFNMLDEVRGIATDRLLASVPTADSAPEGTQDECLNCALPITRKGEAWIDDIMGAKGCMSNADNGVHNPRHVLAAYLLALQEGGKAQLKPARNDMPLLYVVTADGSSREDGSVFYATYLLFNEPLSRRKDIDNALAGLLGGTVNTTGVTFKCGVSVAADDLWDDKDLLLHELVQRGFDVYQASGAFLVGEE